MIPNFYLCISIAGLYRIAVDRIAVDRIGVDRIG